MQMQGGSLIAWEYAADRQRECTVLGGRYSSKASSSALPRLAWNEEGHLVKDCVCVRLWHWASRLGVR